jgi:hypothetical protein
MINIAAVMHVYEVRPLKDHCGVDLISDVLPFGRLYAPIRPHSKRDSDERNY